LIFEGRDTIDEEIGEDDIVFCPACHWHMYLDEWDETEREQNEAARNEMIAGVRQRRERDAEEGEPIPAYVEA
jgi:transposase